MFKDLKGIEKGREEKEKDSKNLEILTDFGDEFIKTKTAHSFWHREDKYKEHGQFVYDALKDVDFNANDLKNYIFAKEGLYTHETAINEAVLLGFYTGCLLTLLTRKNKEKGKDTNFYINGSGITFDWLFHCANEIDKLVVHNFKGEFIGQRIAIHGGKANLVAGIDIDGRFAFQNAGEKKGKIKLAIDCLGEHMMQYSDGKELTITREGTAYLQRRTIPADSTQSNELKIREMLALTESINNSNAEETMDQIYNIYKSVEHLLEK